MTHSIQLINKKSVLSGALPSVSKFAERGNKMGVNFIVGKFGWQYGDLFQAHGDNFMTSEKCPTHYLKMQGFCVQILNLCNQGYTGRTKPDLNMFQIFIEDFDICVETKIERDIGTESIPFSNRRRHFISWKQSITLKAKLLSGKYDGSLIRKWVASTAIKILLNFDFFN